MGIRFRGSPPASNATAQSGAVALLLTALAPQSYMAGAALATTQTGAAKMIVAGGALQSTGSVSTVSVTTLTFTPTLTGTALPVTFGHAFKVGDVPSGTSVEVFGKTTQFDIKATHADGSVRHAIITALTDTSAGVPIIATLRTRAPSSGTAISVANVLASAFDASASLNVGGTVYTLSARELLAGTVSPVLPLVTHISGQQCSEFIIGGKLRNGASAHAHLAAYFHVRAYGSAGSVTRVRCDVQVENGFTFVAGSNTITHNPTLTVGGVVVYSATGYAQPHHTQFSASGWWGGNPQISFAHNSAYLIATKAVPNYAQLTLKEALLATLTATYAPGGIAGLRNDWGATGDHVQIGPMPEWDAAYVVSGDKRALAASIAASKAGGSFSFHYRDENTGHVPSIDTYPTISEQGWTGGLVQGLGGNLLVHDQDADASAHAPLLGYLAYLCTGDYAHLEALLSQTNYFFLWRNTNGRTYLTGPQDGIVGLQNRGQAWGIRNVGAAAYITPDAHPLKSYFVNKLNNNINQKTTNWASPSKNVFGHVQDYDWPLKVTPFENDFMLTVFGWLVDMGYGSAATMRNWLAKSPAGRLGQNASGYCPYYSLPYAWTAGISPTPAGDTFYASWTALYQANYPTQSAQPCPVGLIPGSYQNLPVSTDFTNGFYSNLKPALAMAVDAGVATLASWNLFVSWAVNDYTYSPRYNIVPRALSAVPAWYTALAPGAAIEFTGNLITSVNPCPLNGCSYSGVEGFPGLMNSWSGGCYNSVNHEHVFWGGGHNAYYDNAVYVWNLFTSTWSRRTEPSTVVPATDLVGPSAGQNNTTGYYADGKPASRHTYNALAYDPVRNQMVSVYAGSTAGETGGAFRNCDAFDFASNTWSIKAQSPDLGAYGSPYGNISAVDAAGDVWSIYAGLAPVGKLNRVTNTWTTYGPGYNYGNGAYCSAAVDTLRNRMVIVGGGYLTKTDLAVPGTAVNCGGAPPSAVFNAAAPLWHYDPINDRFVGWSGGQTFHYVDAATLLTWGSFTVTGATLPLCTEPAYTWRGTYGKGVYVPELHGASICVQTGLPPVFVRY